MQTLVAKSALSVSFKLLSETFVYYDPIAEHRLDWGFESPTLCKSRVAVQCDTLMICCKYARPHGGPFSPKIVITPARYYMSSTTIIGLGFLLQVS